MKDMTTVTQGSVGLGVAIAYFLSKGYPVCVPLNDNQPYDLVVDIQDSLKKVQVKTTRSKSKYGSYLVLLRSIRPNRTGNTIKKLDTSKVDYVFIHCEDGTKYLIPALDITTYDLTLNKSKDKYKI